MRVERVLERVEVGHVALDVGERVRLVLAAERDRQPVAAAAEVVGDDGVPAVEQAADRPGADRAERAGHEHAPHQPSTAPSEADETSRL